MEDKKEKLPSTSINWYPGHMLKTKKQMIEDLKNSINAELNILNTDAKTPYDLTVSIGSSKVVKGIALSDLISEADRLMYLNKQSDR